MAGRNAPSSSNGESIYYRCNRYSNYKDCANSKMMNEAKLEQWLLENVEDEINKCLIEYEFREQRRRREKPAVDKAVIKRKLTRLKDRAKRCAISH